MFFAALLRDRRLTEEDLHGLAHRKLGEIRLTIHV